VKGDGSRHSLALLTRFQRELGMPLGPGADVFEDIRSAEDSSKGKTGGSSLNTGRMRGGGGDGLGGRNFVGVYCEFR